MEWNKLDCYISNADLFEVFKKRVLSIIRLMASSIYNIYNFFGVKYLTRLRIRFSHLKEHKVKHKFQDSIDLMCSCSSVIQTAIDFFLHCTNFSSQRQTLFDKIAAIDASILTENEDNVVNTLLFGKPNSQNTFNKAMPKGSIKFIVSVERFNNPLL